MNKAKLPIHLFLFLVGNLGQLTASHRALMPWKAHRATNRWLDRCLCRICPKLAHISFQWSDATDRHLISSGSSVARILIQHAGDKPWNRTSYR